MRSGGFSLGRKQARPEEPKLLPPTNADLTQLLTAAQKNHDKTFGATWHVPSQSCIYSLTVINSVPQRNDRRGWSSSPMHSASMGETEWRLSKEVDGSVSILFSMVTTDSSLIQTLIDEALSGEPGQKVEQELNSAFNQTTPDNPSKQSSGKSPVPPQANKSNLPQEGSLRQTKVDKLLAIYNENNATGRLICDVGTIQSEVFFTNGEPVHAKSCHSISQGRDQTGEVALIDLLTWKDGTFKFQEGWPAASKTINHPLSMFLDGSISLPEPPTTTEVTAAKPLSKESSDEFKEFAKAQVQSQPNSLNSSNSSPVSPGPSIPNSPQAKPTSLAPAPAAAAAAAAAGQDPVPAQAPAIPPPVSLAPKNKNKASYSIDSVDDFSIVDNLISETYGEMIDSSGLIKLGMLLVLVRSEFVRFEKGQVPFCFASIGMDLPDMGQLSEIALGKIGERFEKVCQPLDILSYAGKDRFYAFFPQSDGIAATTTLKQFINNITAIPLDGKLHGSLVKIKIGLSEIPRDGTELQRIFQHAAGLRGQATNEKKLVTSSF
jgi:hypothetical protein